MCDCCLTTDVFITEYVIIMIDVLFFQELLYVNVVKFFSHIDL